VVAIDLENNDGARGFFRDILIGGVVCEASAGEIHAGNGPQREEGRVVRGQWRKRPRCTLGLTRSASSRRVTIYTALHLLVFSRLLCVGRGMRIASISEPGNESLRACQLPNAINRVTPRPLLIHLRLLTTLRYTAIHVLSIRACLEAPNFLKTGLYEN
jgi:hypothetical protein